MSWWRESEQARRAARRARQRHLLGVAAFAATTGAPQAAPGGPVRAPEAKPAGSGHLPARAPQGAM